MLHNSYTTSLLYTDIVTCFENMKSCDPYCERRKKMITPKFMTTVKILAESNKIVVIQL